jgi:tetratricopeptide (TPR) repeat protein
MLDRGLVVEDGGRRRLAPGVDAGRLAAIGAPTSLQMLISSRLDALPAAQRELIQYASVLGNAFTLDGLAAVSSQPLDDVAAAVAGLVARDLVLRVSDRFSPDFGRYAFRQALVRQVAYRTQSRRARLDRHLAAARYLETQAESAGELVAVVAQHLCDARELMPANDRRAESLAVDLVAWLERSGQRAGALAVHEEALSFYTQALSYAGEGEARARLTALAAQAAMDAGHWDRAITLASELREDDPLDLRARAATVRGNARRLLGAIPKAERDFAPFVNRTDELSAETASPLLRMAARAYGELGDPLRGRPLAEEALRRAEETGDPQLIGWALNDIAVLNFFSGLHRVGMAIIDGAIAYCEKHHATSPLSAVLFNRALESFTHDAREAVRFYERSVEQTRQTGDAWGTWLTTAALLMARTITGQDDDVDDNSWLYEAVLAENDILRYVHEALRYLRAIARGEEPPDGVAEMADGVIDGAGPEMVQEVALIRLVRGRVVGGLREHALRIAESTVTARAEFGGTVEWFPFLWAKAVDWLMESGTPDDLDAARRALAVVADAPGRREPAVAAQLPRLRATLALLDPVTLVDPASIERDLRTAIDALEAYGAVPDRARAQQALGRFLADRGRAEEAAALLQEAAAVLDRSAPIPPTVLRLEETA